MQIRHAFAINGANFITAKRADKVIEWKQPETN